MQSKTPAYAVLIWLPWPAELLIRFEYCHSYDEVSRGRSNKKGSFHGETQPRPSLTADPNLNHIFGKKMARPLFHELDQEVNQNLSV